MMGSPTNPSTLAPPPQPHRPPGGYVGTMPLGTPMGAQAGALPPPQPPPPSGHTAIAGPGAGGMAYTPPQGPPPMIGMPPAYAVAQGQGGPVGRPGESTSLPPGSVAGVPRKSNAPLVLGIVFGLMLLVGASGIAIFFLRSGKKDDLHGVPSATASIASVVPAGSAEPPPTATVSAPAPTESESAAPPEPESDAGEPAPPATATATATATETAAPPPQPVEPRPGPTTVTPVEPRPAPQPVAVRDAGAPVDPNAFNETLARSRLGQANGVLVFCNQKGLTGPGSATVTFNPDGSVGAVALDPPYAGTPAGDCVAGQFKRQKITPFQGTPHPLKHSFDVPK
jgi:hypothetical protein